MIRYTILFALCVAFLAAPLYAQAPRSETFLETGWKFARGEHLAAKDAEFDDGAWQSVTVPHDWAIYGPFDMAHDQQDVAIVQNFEQTASVKSGRTGALPYVGVGWYRTTFDVADFDPETRRVYLVFDGAMSEARVYVNGTEAGFWPYGYNSFYFDVTELLNKGGSNNQLAVRLQNMPESSRWYPGAGIYRNVRVLAVNKLHVPVWGAFLTTPFVSGDFASVRIQLPLENAGEAKAVRLETTIFDAAGKIVAVQKNDRVNAGFVPLEQNITVEAPRLWSPETPYLYTAVTKIFTGETQADEIAIRFGIRQMQFVAHKGFFLNGKPYKFQGVCNHHDLGPLGAAVNRAALARQLTILKDMGCNAIRTAHNMPAPELVALCDEMGFLVIVESFDEWNGAKCKNGYNRYYKDWAEKDLVNMVRQFRNHPSVVLWSIGNEVPNQWWGNGHENIRFLQDICHREDPTRLVNCGMDQADGVIKNGFAAQLDIPGLNYRTHFYHKMYETQRCDLVLGSETASTVSSRGVYKFPVQKKNKATYPDFQSSSYDMEFCPWSNLPEADFILCEENEWVPGQFVWTGFDYLGEPTPYDSAQTPNHSSMFGIVDLASIPKDRFYLYRSVWNTESDTLHILPHWTWPGREGETTPVFVYTNHPTAELFLNGVSQGKRTKDKTQQLDRYRLRWMDVKYAPGELKVVAYDAAGKAVGEKAVRTAGAPAKIVLVPDRETLSADGKDLAYVNVKLVDKDGNFCPTESAGMEFTVSGAGTFRAAANGDPTSLELFHEPKMRLFSGQLTVLVQAGTEPGTLSLEVRTNDLPPATVAIGVE